MSSDLQREHGCKSFHKVVRPPFLNNSTSEDWNKSAVQPCNEMWDLFTAVTHSNSLKKTKKKRKASHIIASGALSAGF